MKHRIERSAVVLFAVGAAAFSVSLSCNRSRPDAKPDKSSSATAPLPEQPGAHWVQDERLRAVMRQISEHTKRWPAWVPDDPEVKQSRESEEAAEAFRDAAALADGLADAAEQIPQAVRGRRMAPEDRRGFNNEAQRMRRQAVELKAAAEGRRVERMQRALDAISSTCVACHGRYRDFAGKLRPRKASAE